VVVIVAAVIGPPRDYWYMARFPEWGAYGPGVAPVLAIAATYVVMVVLGHGVMRLVAGPARESPLARRPWETAEPSAASDPARHVAFWDFKAPRAGQVSLVVRRLWEVRSAMPSGFMALKLVHRGHRGPGNLVGAKDSKSA
jgi:hypothetical protein